MNALYCLFLAERVNSRITISEFIKEFAELETLNFINEKENIILIGTPGACKTHYAIGLGIKALATKR